MGVCDLFFPILFIAAFFIKFSFSDSYPSFETCSPSACNNSTIKYPFESWSYGDRGACNDIAYTDCPNNHNPLLHYIDIDAGLCFEYTYRVLGGITQSSYSSRTIRISLDTRLDDCSSSLTCLRNNHSDFYLSDKYRWGTIFICATEPRYKTNLKSIQCLECRSPNEYCFFFPSSRSFDYNICRNYSVVIPADINSNISDEKTLLETMQTGFEIKWNISNDCQSCEASGGRCYTPTSMSKFEACICANGTRKNRCFPGKPFHKKKWWKTPRYVAAIEVVLCIIFTTATIIITIKINEKKRKQREEELEIKGYMDPIDSRRASIENFLHGGIPTRYSLRQIKRYTNNFLDRLGQGGFGTVFKGQLPNGRMVAIKILGKSEHSQNQFMNEVATIGRIHHLHLVQLLGYCFEGSKRALIYEYMVNGSLEKYIYGDNPNVLDWKQLYSIAIGTARGIAYLHDECRSRILHCDIKPHNVLLDASFSPKVADFGLAKLTNREETHVSLTGARGTPGYVAPEVFFRNYGPVSDKSDVYSYGMLVMEMVGGRKNFDTQTTRSSKFYFPEWAFKQVEIGEFGRLREGNIANEEDENIAKKLSLLGLWCIQYHASQRPSMKRVIQILEGSVDITIPPQPFPLDPLPQTTATTESSSSTF